jgi:hypothetical protein
MPIPARQATDWVEDWLSAVPLGPAVLHRDLPAVLPCSAEQGRSRKPQENAGRKRDNRQIDECNQCHIQVEGIFSVVQWAVALNSTSTSTGFLVWPARLGCKFAMLSTEPLLRDESTNKWPSLPIDFAMPCHPHNGLVEPESVFAPRTKRGLPAMQCGGRISHVGC